ncbi:hypothetical protein [Frondihabitans sp. 762G35]|uniref:hypothetical protein n=1 Tax=Frondihabitans sp. 762G35 TaxID=1446794 RepID=UPI000F4FC81C|nr:hypothetical protein [Frondihabitans sp. 762G35]
MPESLGFTILRDPFLEFHFVAWVGGWADVSYFKGAHIISAAPTFSSVEEAAAVTQREIDLFAE